MLFGDDFQYQNALHDFKNIDKLIKYVNAQVHIYIYIYIYLLIPFFTEYKFSKLMVVT